MAETLSRPDLRVDWRASVGLVGTVLKYLGVPLLLPLLVAVAYGQGIATFGVTIVCTVLLGLALERLDPDPDLGPREALLMVSLTWLAVALVGTIPYLLAGHVTGTEAQSSLAHPVNALFESMSGFTTTGATVMQSINVTDHSHAIMLYRQLTQWLGGMGIVVLAVAILPELSVGGAQLMEAEAPGPGIEKLTPRIRQTARNLWLAYLGFTVLEIALLYGLHLVGWAPTMSAYGAVAHGLTTLPTGGFSPQARSIEAFSAAVQWVIIPFMVVAGTNFALFWRGLTGDLGAFAEDDEFRFYAGVLAVLTAVVGGLLFLGAGGGAPGGGGLESSLRHAAFQVVSIVTTTGYASVDFNAWGTHAQYLLLAAMFVGGSAGSTGGSIKMVRWLVILKSARRELFSTVHPAAVRPVRLGGRALDERAVRGIHTFTALYLVLFAVSVLVLLLQAPRLSVLEALSAVAASIGNVGPGFGTVGPMGNYEGLPATGKLLLVFLMWVGRLEVFPVLVLLTRGYWQS